ncbi:MAG: DUF1566 domain-containing protein [Gammaproteobacteria bacterium]|nr:DUF1566 domain-containing protein [Gammaproteobacteria bacterium]
MIRLKSTRSHLLKTLLFMSFCSLSFAQDFQQELNNFRFSLHEQLVISDADEMRKGLHLNETFHLYEDAPALIRTKKFLQEHQQAIIAYQKQLLSTYGANKDIKKDWEKYHLVEASKIDTITNRINKELAESPLFRLAYLNPEKLITVYRRDALFELMVNLPYDRRNQASFFDRRIFDLIPPLVQATRLNDHQWNIIVNDYYFIYTMNYDLSTAQLTDAQIYQRKDKGKVLVEVDKSTAKMGVEVTIENAEKKIIKKFTMNKPSVEIELDEGKGYRIFGVSDKTSNPMWIKKYKVHGPLRVYGREFNLAGLRFENLDINPEFSKEKLKRIQKLINITDTYSIKPTRKDDFIVQNDGTVIDTRTKLQWSACALPQKWVDGSCVGEEKFFSIEDAKIAAKLSSLAGHNDWRLPTNFEIETLLYCYSGKMHQRGGKNQEWVSSGCNVPYDDNKMVIVEKAFPSKKGRYWTSTVDAYGGYVSAREFNMGQWSGIVYGKKKTPDCYECYAAQVLLVRDVDSSAQIE